MIEYLQGIVFHQSACLANVRLNLGLKLFQFI